MFESNCIHYLVLSCSQIAVDQIRKECSIGRPCRHGLRAFRNIEAVSRYPCPAMNPRVQLHKRVDENVLLRGNSMNSFLSSRSRNSAAIDRRRRLLRSMVFATIASLMSATSSWAGPSTFLPRTYCVTGTSTPKGWEWEIPKADLSGKSWVSSVPVNDGRLINGAPASAIVAEFIKDLERRGVTGPPAAVPTDCFTYTGGALSINGAPVMPFPKKLTFNPEITDMTPKNYVPSFSQLSLLVQVGLMGVAILYAMRWRRQHADQKAN